MGSGTGLMTHPGSIFPLYTSGGPMRDDIQTPDMPAAFLVVNWVCYGLIASAVLLLVLGHYTAGLVCVGALVLVFFGSAAVMQCGIRRQEDDYPALASRVEGEIARLREGGLSERADQMERLYAQWRAATTSFGKLRKQREMFGGS